MATGEIDRSTQGVNRITMEIAVDSYIGPASGRQRQAFNNPQRKNKREYVWCRREPDIRTRLPVIAYVDQHQSIKPYRSDDVPEGAAASCPRLCLETLHGDGDGTWHKDRRAAGKLYLYLAKHVN